MVYKPSYVWPNPAFPFRLFYDGGECRVFIIENFQHNWNWLSQYHKKIRDTDYFFVYCGWYFSEGFAREADRMLEVLDLKRENFFVMFNSPKEMSNFMPYGILGDVINHNAWLDERMFPSLESEVKNEYDAIYVARLSAFKRHHLASQVKRLALVAGLNHGNREAESLPEHVYRNDRVLAPTEVFEKIRQSRCGLILSEVEGACFSSSEYLLCGVPVVSTRSVGGRDVWYDDYNAIVCEPDEEAIADAVTAFVSAPRDANKIRAAHVAKSEMYRTRFVRQLQRVFDRYGSALDAEQYFLENFYHKLRKSYRPNFDEIFT